MKITKFTIKNYRSIKEIKDFQLLDNRITCFVGPNGSGKSNILKAIAAVKSDNFLTEDDFYAKDKPEPIYINVDFHFSQEDQTFLEEKGINFTDIGIGGVSVELIKEPNQVPSRHFIPLGFNDKSDKSKQKIYEILEDIINLTNKLDVPEEQKQLKLDIDTKLKEFSSIGKEELIQKLPELKTLIEAIRPYDQQYCKEVNNKISEIEQLASFSIEKIILEIFQTLTIELLDIETYKIEHQAPIAELKSREPHPFLFDLLTLSNKTADDFEKALEAQEKRIEDAASKQLSDSINKVWGTHVSSYEIDKQQGTNLFFGVKTPQNQFIGLQDLSDGEKWFLRFYTRLAIAQRENKNIIWLFDEPGHDLHATSQINLKEFFEEIAKASQIIYATHQPMLVPWHRLERLFVVENDKDKGTTLHKRFWKDEVVISPLREALSSFIGEELLTGKEHVIVEGISDYFYLQGWLRFFQNTSTAQLWYNNYEVLKRTIIPVQGIGQIPLYCWFLGKKAKHQVNWVVVVDSGQKCNDLVDKFEKLGLAQWAKKIKNIKELSGGNSSPSEFDIEDLFDINEYIQEFREYYKNNFPNVQLPSDSALHSLKEGKITNSLTKLLQEKNPEIFINNKAIEVDKIGIAQQIYLKLTKSKKLIYKKETEQAFKKILENINKAFKK